MRTAGRTATAAILAVMTILASVGITQYVDQPLPPGPTATLAATNTPGGPTNTPTATLASTATFTPMPTSTNTPGPTATATPSAAMSLGTLALHPTFNSIDVELPFDDGTSVTLSSVALEFKKSADATWRDGLPLWPTRPRQTGTPLFQPSQPAAFGAVLLADAGTSYDVRVTATGSDGSTLQATGSTTTRAEDIPAAADISGTVYYVNASTGDDSRSVTVAQTKATPWRTIGRAISQVPAGAIIELAPGYYVQPISAAGGSSTSRPVNKSMTFRAEFPALDDDLNVINAGNHSVIQDGGITGTGAATEQVPYTTGPTGSGVAYENVWAEDATLSGIAGKPIWKWAGSNHGIGRSNVYTMGFHQTRDGLLTRIMHWDRLTDSGTGALPTTTTAAGWAETLTTNKTYNYGFWQDSVAPYDIYLAPPTNMVDTTGAATGDPNETFITVGGDYGFFVQAADVRFTGLEIRAMTDCISVGSTSTNSSTYNNVVVDHNLFSSCINGVRADTSSSPNNGLGLGSTDGVIERNLFYDRTFWSDDFTTDPGSPWVFVKEKITRPNGTLSATARYGGRVEGTGINAKNEGGKWYVVRHNRFDGPQNGMSMNGGVPKAPRDAVRGWDVYENECVHIVDDCVEPENATVNWKVWGNTIHKTSVAVSMAPTHWGPIFFFRNTMYEMGAHGAAEEASSGRARVGTSAMLKGGGLSDAFDRMHVRPIIYFLHNTYYTDIDGSGAPGNSDVGGSAIDMTINGEGTYNQIIYSRNNVIAVTRYVARIGAGDEATNWDEDYNAMAARNSVENGTNINFVGMRRNQGFIYSSSSPSVRDSGSTTTGLTIADYRTDFAALSGRPATSGNGAHTNKFGAAGADEAFASVEAGTGAFNDLKALLTDPDNGDLTLAPGTNPLVDAGVPVPNLSDRSGVDYDGAAPDIGAVER